MRSRTERLCSCGILDASGLCVNAGRKQLRFAVNEISMCQLRLNYDSFTDCTALRFLSLQCYGVGELMYWCLR